MYDCDTSRSRHPWPHIVWAVIAALLVAVAASSSRPETDRDVAERLSVEALEAKVTRIERFPRGRLSARVAGTLIWTFLGPNPIANEYWSGTANASGRLSSVAVHPTDGNTVYVAAAGGGVWKTMDGGITWMPLTDQLSSLASGALAIDRVNPDTVLYGTGEQHYSGDSLYGDGVFRTEDAGATWTKIALKAQVGNYIARVGLSTGVLHVCSDLGYVRSIDGGATWSSFRPASAWCNDLVRSAAAPGTLFAGFYRTGIYKSADDGLTWTRLTGGLPPSGFERINLASSDSNPDVVYASLITPGGTLLGMYKTTDGGNTWFPLLLTPNYVCTQGWYDNAVIVAPNDPDTVYAAGVFPYCVAGGIIKSTDGGTTWTNVTVGSDGSQVHPDQHALAFGPDGGLWVGSDGGVWKTLDGGSTWLNRNEGLATAQFYTVAVHPNDASFLVAGTQDNGSLQYQGTLRWPQVAAGDGGPAAVEWDNPDLYYTTYVRLNPLYKFLRPIIFQRTVTGPWGSDRADWANGPLVVDPNWPSTLLAGTHRVWQTSDSGSSWTSISPDLTGGSGVLRTLAIAPESSSTIYSGSSNGRVHVTLDGGVTWVPRNTGLPIDGAIPDIVVDPLDSRTAYLCANRPSGQRLFHTTDAGQTWQDLTGSLPAGLRPLSLAVDFETRVVYLGMDYGVYSTSDGGLTWIQEGTNLPNVAVYNVRIDTANRLIVAATHGRGMWSAPLPVKTTTASQN